MTFDAIKYLEEKIKRYNRMINEALEKGDYQEYKQLCSYKKSVELALKITMEREKK